MPPGPELIRMLGRDARKWLVWVGLLASGWPLGDARSAGVSHLYVTWIGAEPDKGASAWYIKRHVDPQAIFQTAPEGYLFESGTVFDAPQGHYRRIQNASTLETLLRDYPSSDPIIAKLGLLMHDIEINIWQPKRFPESLAIESRVKEIGTAYGDKGIPMSCFIAFFDGVESWLRAGRTSTDLIPRPSACIPVQGQNDAAHSAGMSQRMPR